MREKEIVITVFFLNHLVVPPPFVGGVIKFKLFFVLPKTPFLLS
jgi:hypothetical protein